MATKLIKTVTRECLGLKSRRKNLPVLASLCGGDVLSFRVKGERRSMDVSLGHCLVLAQMMTAHDEYSKKKERYEKLKKEGKRAVKPKKLFLPFSKMYFDALKVNL